MNPDDEVILMICAHHHYIPIIYRRDKAGKLIEKWVNGEPPFIEHRAVMIQDNDGVSAAVAVDAIVAIYVGEKNTPQERIARSVEKSLSEGEDWKE